MDPSPTGTTAAVNWDNVSDDVACPLCAYNLRGLAEPRCPECGHRFEWSELLAASVVHPWLFEHHPESNLRSLLRTLYESICAQRFWTSVRPTHRIRPKRLLAFLMAPLLLTTVIPLAALMVRQCSQISSSNQQMRTAVRANIRKSDPRYAQYLVAQYGSVEAYMNRFYPVSPIDCLWRWYNDLNRNHTFWWVATRLLLILLWPLISLLTLLIFVRSFRRSRIRLIQLVRCVVYASGVFVIFAALLAANLGFAGSDFQRWTPSGYGTLVVSILIYELIFIRNLIQAFKRYLEFPHPMTTVLASQFIAILIGLQLAVLPTFLTGQLLF